MGYFSDMLGTTLDSFKVGRATLSAALVTSPRSFSLPDQSGTLALVSQLGGSVPAIEVVVDLGSSPISGGTFTVADAAATTASKVKAWVSGSMPDGRDSDELECDAVEAYASCQVDGTVSFFLSADPGPVSGSYRLFYQIE
jgi:hypothetical protein